MLSHATTRPGAPDGTPADEAAAEPMREAERQEEFIAGLVAREMEERGKRGGDGFGEGGEGEKTQERGWEDSESEMRSAASGIEGLSLRSKRERERSECWGVQTYEQNNLCTYACPTCLEIASQERPLQSFLV